MEESLLSDLCSVCHFKSPKYKCPRCSTRTCSLECSRRHKQRSGCSGERDQTAFIPKSKLFTAAGVDHDYNFLSGVEKNINGKNEGVQNNLPRNARSDRRKSTHYRSQRYWQLIDKIGIKVNQAPVGLSRERMNRSQVVNHGENILFTIEWIFEDDSRITSRSEDSHTLAMAYDLALRIKSGAPRTYGVKRKRGEEEEEEVVKRQVASETHVQTNSSEVNPKDIYEPAHSKSNSNTEDKKEAPVSDVDEGIDSTVAECRDPSQDHESKAAQIEDPTTLKSADIPNQTDNSSDQVIYLVKPQTSGTDRVLIRVSDEKPLAEVLKGKTILEFPTFQLLKGHSIPPGFILEEEYLLKEKTEQDEMLAILAEGENLIPDHSAPEAENVSLPGSDKVMESLRKDITISQS